MRHAVNLLTNDRVFLRGAVYSRHVGNSAPYTHPVYHEGPIPPRTGAGDITFNGNVGRHTSVGWIQSFREICRRLLLSRCRRNLREKLLEIVARAERVQVVVIVKLRSLFGILEIAGGMRLLEQLDRSCRIALLQGLLVG